MTNVTSYFESQSHGERVLHLDKLVSERVGPPLLDVWDVHSTCRAAAIGSVC
jgi:hypothetical protein